MLGSHLAYQSNLTLPAGKNQKFQISMLPPISVVAVVTPETPTAPIVLVTQNLFIDKSAYDLRSYALSGGTMSFKLAALPESRKELFALVQRRLRVEDEEKIGFFGAIRSLIFPPDKKGT